MLELRPLTILRSIALIVLLSASGCLQAIEGEPTREGADGGTPAASGTTDVAPTCDEVPTVDVQAAYVARHVRTLAPPLASPSGVASSATGLWLIAGGHNASEHTLQHVDLSTGDITFTHTYENLIEQLGTGVYGVESDGSSVWISVSGNTNKLVEVDATNGDIVRTMGSPTILGPSDLAFHGDDLIVATGTGEVYSIQLGALSEVELLFTVRGEIVRDTGVAVRGDVLFVPGLFRGFDAYSTDGAFLGEVVREDGQRFPEGGTGPVAFYGDQLVMLQSSGLAFYELCAVPAP